MTHDLLTPCNGGAWNGPRVQGCVCAKRKGFGVAVIGKLKETQVKKNLYYEIKDKVVEEVTQNGQLVRVSRRTKVYGLHSTHDVRNQLIELLRERMSYHKDKFISPTIYKELTGLEVKKSGKVEHSDLTHDDQIFSYLMAMYVWYEGKNLRELFGLEKVGIKTEESIDEEIDMATGPKNQVDMSKYLEIANRPSDDLGRLRVEVDLNQMNQGKGMLFSEFVSQQRKREDEHLRWMLRDARYREAYARYYGVPVDSVDGEVGRSSYDDVGARLPQSLFTDFNKDPEELDDGSVYRNMPSGFATNYGEDPYTEDETRQ